ncbi:MAG: RNA-guided pseudouridylation complex pseudouridine synthase subunit Cbf5 [Candidatus Woesearchaeota archaeon]
MALSKGNDKVLPGLYRNYETLIIREEEHNKDYGHEPNNRPIETLLNCCFINLDKPSGPTSHQATDYAKKIIQKKKAGHTGTLDPKVTGVLPIGIGRAAKLSQLLLPAGKEYVGILHLHENVPEKLLVEVIKNFLGDIDQLPPVKSAVRRRLRVRRVYYFEILERKDRDILFRVGVQAGTYIRKLCHDIGISLGCGANMGELRRTVAGPFTESNSVILHDLRDAYALYKEDNNSSILRRFLIPVEESISHIPKAYVSDDAVWSICHGSPLYVPGVVRIDSDVTFQKPAVMMTLKGELIGFGIARMNASDVVKKNKGVVCQTDSIIMESEHYPKIVS